MVGTRPEARDPISVCRMLLLAFLPVLSPAQVSADDAYVSIGVTTSEGQALQGISTYAFTSAGAYTGKTIKTDLAGQARYPASGFAAGFYKFRADYLGSQFWSDAVALPGISTVPIPIAVEPVSVTIRQGIAPKAGVRVYLFGASGAYLGLSATSDAQGRAGFVLPAGKEFKFRADNLGSQYWSDPFVVSSGQANELLIETGGGTFAVTLDQGDGAPLAGVNGYLFSANGSYLGLAAKTDPQGRLAFAVPTGHYKVRCDYLGYPFWTDATAVTSDVSVVFSIPHRAVAFQVRGVFGDSVEPRGGIPCYLFSEAGAYLGQSRSTDAEGQAIFRLPERSFKVRADYLSFQYWSPATIGDGREIVIPEAVADVIVTRGEVPSPTVPVYVFNPAGAYLGLSKTTGPNGVASFRLPARDLKFRADLLGNEYFQQTSLAADQVNSVSIATGGGPFTLTVDVGAGLPLPGASSYLFNESGSYLGVSRKTDDAGRAVFQLPDGIYRFRVDYLGHQFWTDFATVPQSATLDLRLPQAQARVRVLQGGASAAGATVYLFSDAGTYLGVRAVTDDLGYAVFTLPVGVGYRFRADLLGGQYLGDVLVISEETTNEVSLDTGGGTLSLVVDDGEGTALAGKPVYLFSDAGAYLGLSAVTDTAGRAGFEVPSGGYKVRCDYLGSQFWSPTTVVTGGTALSLPIPHRALSATVRLDRMGQPIPAGGVHVYLFTEAGSYVGETRTTDAQGRASFVLPEGTYKLRADLLGLHQWSEPFTWTDPVITIGEGKAAATVTKGGSPLAGIRIYVFSAAGSYLGLSATTDAQGRAPFWLPGGRYRIRADADGNQFFSDVIIAAGTESAVYIEVPGPAPQGVTPRIAAGYSHVVALRSDGSLWAWGGNWDGQVGDGTKQERGTPVPVGTATDWRTAAAGDSHTVALKADGSLWAWGANSAGQLGDGTTEDRTAPSRIGADQDWDTVATGSEHTVALKKDGSLWAWGSNWDGQLGDGTEEDRTAPTRVGADADWKALTAGYGHTVALKADGTLWAWGSNWDGQLGDGSTENRSAPTRIGTESNWVAVAVGEYHTVALKADGSLWAWGSNWSGELGDGTREEKTVPTRIGTDNDWTAVAAAGNHTLALKADGSLWAWGSNFYGELGDGTTSDRSTPGPLGTGERWLAVAAGYSFTLALRADGSLWACGENAGALGNGGLDHRTRPVRIGSGWAAAAPASSSWQDYSTAIREDGSLWAWGKNSYGQFGNGSTADARVPTHIGPDNDWRAAAAGAVHTHGLKTDGTLWSWGYNSEGQLGDGTIQTRNTPVQTGPAPDWSAVAAGGSHAVALKTDGSLWAWGWNGTGALGDGSIQNKNSPTRIGTETDWQVVSAGSAHTAAVKTDGSLFAWGSNREGQLGDGTTAGKTSPTKIGLESNWRAVSTAGAHTIAVRADGSLWAWGENSWGQLGDGTTEGKTSPVRIGVAADWQAANTGQSHTVGLKVDGSLWAWGNNWEGQLGDGTLEDRLTPVRVGTDADWRAAWAGSHHTLALKADGTLWAWGSNRDGQLGEGTPDRQPGLLPVAQLNLVQGSGPPPIPIALSGLQGSDASHVALEWTLPPGATGVVGFHVYRSGERVGATSVPSFTDAFPDRNASYSYEVSAYGADDKESARSVPWIKPDWVAPSAPTNLAGARGADAWHVVLQWAPSTDNSAVAGYRVYRDGVRVGTTADLSLSDALPCPGGTHEYSVAAFDAGGNTSTPSSPVQVAPLLDSDADGLDDDWETANFGTLVLGAADDPDGDGTANLQEFLENTDTLDRQAPTVPQGLTGRPGLARRQVVLDWQPSMDSVAMAGYRIYRFSGTWILIGTSPDPSFTDTQPDDSGPYWYRVAGLDLKGNESIPSLTVSVTGTLDSDADGLDDAWELANFGALALGPNDDPDDDGVPNLQEFAAGTDTKDRQPPAAPANLQAKPSAWIEAGHVDLSWSPSEDNVGVSNYNIYMDGRRVATSPGTSLDTGAAWWGTCHHFQVSAVDFSGNESPLSAVAASLGGPGAAASVFVSSPTDGQAVTARRITVSGWVGHQVDLVAVNGQLASIRDGVFTADVIDLQEGANAITVYAQNWQGYSSSSTVTVTRVGSEEPILITPSSSSGVGALAVQFALTSGLSRTITKYEWDLDADGVFEVESTAGGPRSHTYTKPRLYWVRARITDSEGAMYTAVTPVRVGVSPSLVRSVSAQDPDGIAIDSQGNVYVVEKSAGRVAVYGPDGSFRRAVGSRGNGSHQLMGPTRVALDGDGNVYVVDAGNGRIQKYDPQGAHLTAFGQGILSSPHGISVYHSLVLVTDISAQLVYSFDSSGTFLGALGDANGPGALDRPLGVAISPAQEILVADSGHHRVARFTLMGDYLGSFGSHGTGDGHFSTPADVAWDNVQWGLIVADQGNNRVVFFDPLGLTKSLAHGAALGFSSPQAVAAATDGLRQYIYLTGPANQVVQLEVPTPTPLEVWDTMKAHLAAGRREEALALFGEASRPKYRALFCYAGTHLPDIAASLPAVSPLNIRGSVAAYWMEKEGVIDGVQSTVPYFIYFEKDGSDEWRIRDF